MKRKTPQKKTSARRFDPRVSQDLAVLKTAVHSASANAWRIGDLVNKLKFAGVKVKDQAEMIGCSRQRLSEYRRTAVAVPAESRRSDIDFQYYAVAVQSARKLGLDPVEVVQDLLERKIDSARAATRYLAERLRHAEAMRAQVEARSAGLAGPGLWNRCHHSDFRLVFQQIEGGSVKLIVADPPYGQYGKADDCDPVRVSAAVRDCDGLDDDSSRALHLDLFRLSYPLVQPGGCLIVCRPGGLADPVWLLDAADRHGWSCRHAVAWKRGSPKLGDGRTPYTASTERLLIFARQGEELLNHDGSTRSDILEVSQPRKSRTRWDQHAFEKPVELMERLIEKHTYLGETVVEPCGGSGPVCRAAVRLGRQWVYADSNEVNFRLGSCLIDRELEKQAAGHGRFRIAEVQSL